MKIVKMQEEHIGALAAMEYACFAAPWSAQALREELSNQNAVFLVAQNDLFDAVCGYVGCHFVLDEGYITNVAVLPGCRRQGIAARLIARLLELAEEQGLSFVTLEVRASNAPAIALYQKMGFQEVGTRPNFYSSPQEDALLMTRFLGKKEESAIQVRFADVASPEFQKMANALDTYYKDRFGALAEQYTHDLSTACAAAVAYREGKAVGACCWCAFDAVTAELKRLYVAPQSRRSGVATALLNALEQNAAENGCHRAVLETGAAMTDATALYEACGYRRIPGYGEYANDELCVCFEKELGENAK